MAEELAACAGAPSYLMDPMDPEPHAQKLRNGFFAHAGVAEEEKQGSIRRTRLGLLVLNFVPSWFSVNMGTGIISLLLYTLPHTFTGLQEIAMGFYVLNLLLFVIFVGLSIARYTMHPWLVYRMLRNPTVRPEATCAPSAAPDFTPESSYLLGHGVRFVRM